MAQSLAEPEKLVVRRGQEFSRTLVDAGVGKPSSTGDATRRANSSLVEIVPRFAALRAPHAAALWRVFLHRRIKNPSGLAQPVFQPQVWSEAGLLLIV
jgi:hypothetical protein